MEYHKDVNTKLYDKAVSLKCNDATPNSYKPGAPFTGFVSTIFEVIVFYREQFLLYPGYSELQGQLSITRTAFGGYFCQGEAEAL